MNKVGHTIRAPKELQERFAIVKCCLHVFHSNFNMYAYCISFKQIYRHIGYNSTETQLLSHLNLAHTKQHHISFVLAYTCSRYLFFGLFIHVCLYVYTQRIRVFLLREYSEYILDINKFIRYSWRQQTHGTPCSFVLIKQSESNNLTSRRMIVV